MHPKDKLKCTNYLASLKLNSEMVPFLVKFETGGYYSDYDLISFKKNIDLNNIEKKLKTNKYQNVHEFYRDLKAHFENFVIFCFEGDHVNIVAKRFIKYISYTEKNHTPIYHEHIVQPPAPQKPPPKVYPQEPSKRTTLAQKLYMIYLLRTYEDNFQYIKEIGDSYKIGNMVDNQYIIRLEGHNWAERLKK